MTKKYRVQLFLVAVLFTATQSILAEEVQAIHLQNAPNSFEPISEPSRVRVDDQNVEEV